MTQSEEIAAVFERAAAALNALGAQFNRQRREFEATLSAEEAVVYAQLQLDNPDWGWLDAAVVMGRRRRRRGWLRELREWLRELREFFNREP